MSGEDGRNTWWNRRKALLGGGAVALGTAGYAALHSPEQPQARVQVAEGVFRRGNAAEPDTLDPALSSATWEDCIIGDLLIGLLTEDADGKPVAGMAESWSVSPDGLTWIFKLRDSVWSDGAPLTADDFIFAWRRLLDPKSAAPYAYFINVFKNAQQINAGKLPLTALGAQALDRRTIRLELEHPAPYLPQMMTHASCFPVPRHVVEAKGKAWTRPGSYVCNGAYMLSSWRPNDNVTLVRNPRFFDAANVTVERVVFFPTSDYGAGLRSLRAGELDIQDRFDPQQFSWIKQNMPELVDRTPQLIIDMIGVNHTLPQFQDKRVRRALNLLLNRDAITDKIRRADEPAAYQLVPPGIANYPGGQTLPFKAMAMDDRVAEARRLMQAAGYGPRRPLRASYLIRSTAAGMYRAVAAAIQQMLSLGWINVSIVASEAQVFYNRIQYQDFEICQPGWSADFDDASNFLDLLKTGSGNNWGRYSNPAFDAALDAAQREIDIVRRGALLAQAEKIALDDDAIMPLFFWVNTNLVRPYVTGWKPNGMDKHRTRWVRLDEAARKRVIAAV